MNLSITAREDITMRDLLRLYESGHSVYRTPHTGNWRLYKILSSELGLPNCIWELTCINRDINNHPAYQSIGGQKIKLIDEPLVHIQNRVCLSSYYKIPGKDVTLAHFHSEPLKQLFGDKVITSQSKLLLEYETELLRVFEVIQSHMPSKLGRYILPCGCMVTLDSNLSASCIHGSSSVYKDDLASSAIETLKELNTLVWNPSGYTPKGGVIYSFVLAAVSFYLWSFWKFGDKPIYQLSGPDLIEYGPQPEFKQKISRIFKLLKRHLPSLVPSNLDIQIIPTMPFDFGYLENNENVDVTEYTQHDMIKDGTRIKIKEEYLDIPFSEMKSSLEI